jgi:hypothetical protein
MYQLYAYGKKYTTDDSIPSLAIIYPKNEYFTGKLETFFFEDNLVLNIYPFDFAGNEEDQISEIIKSYF